MAQKLRWDSLGPRLECSEAGFGAQQLGLTQWFVVAGVLLCLAMIGASFSKTIRALDEPQPEVA
jgi:hypothetical protein